MSDLTFGVAPPGFRLPASARVGRVTLRVADLERSLGFYRDIAGFRVIQRSTGASASAQLGAIGSDEILLELREQRGLRPVPRRGLHRAVSLRVAPAGSPVARPVPPAHHGRRRHARRRRSPRQRSAVSHRSRRHRDGGLPRSAARRVAREPSRAGHGERSARPGGTRRGGRCGTLGRRAAGIDHRPHALLRRGARRRRGVLPRGARVRQNRLELPRRAVSLGRRLSPPRRHEHLGGRRAARVSRRTPGSTRGSSCCRIRRACATRCAASRAPDSPRARSIAALLPPIRGAVSFMSLDREQA